VDSYWAGTWYRYYDNKKILVTKTVFDEEEACGYVHYQYFGTIGKLVYGKSKYEAFRKKFGREPLERPTPRSKRVRGSRTN
jgi:hypothetical protein